MNGGDLAMWDTPVKSFISPVIDSAIGAVNKDYVPEAVKERRNVDEYFDKLEYLKNRKLYQEAVESGNALEARSYKAKYQKTVSGALTSDIDTEQELLRSYIALPDTEKPYFASFINANEEDRETIGNMLPDGISSIYKTVWNRKDVVDTANENGVDPSEALRVQTENENEVLKESNRGEYNKYAHSSHGDTSFKEHLADAEAEGYISEVTGVPDDDFVGWDPRIDLDEVKLRTLQVGGEDMHDYGFWSSDEERLKRLIAVTEEEQVTTRIEDIKDGIKRKGKAKDELRRSLTENGFVVNDIELIESRQSNITVNVEAD